MLLPIAAAVLIAASIVIAVWGNRQDPLVSPGDTVYLFGDSLAVGLTPYLRKLAEADGVWFGADGEVGSTIDKWGSRGPDGAAAAKAKVAIIVIGTNDAVTNPDWQAAFAGKAAALVSSLRAQGIEPVWVNPPTMPFSTDTILAGIAASGARVFPSQRLTIERSGDLIHPTLPARDAWAQEIWQALRT